MTIRFFHNFFHFGTFRKVPSQYVKQDDHLLGKESLPGQVLVSDVPKPLAALTQPRKGIKLKQLCDKDKSQNV
jgi:hypothetical protein